MSQAVGQISSMTVPSAAAPPGYFQSTVLSSSIPNSQNSPYSSDTITQPMPPSGMISSSSSLPLQFESENEDAGSLLAQTSSSSNSSTTKTVLLVALGVNVALLSCFLLVSLLDLKLEWSQPPEERFGTTDYRRAEKKHVERVRTEWVQKDKAKDLSEKNSEYYAGNRTLKDTLSYKNKISEAPFYKWLQHHVAKSDLVDGKMTRQAIYKRFGEMPDRELVQLIPPEGTARDAAERNGADHAASQILGGADLRHAFKMAAAKVPFEEAVVEAKKLGGFSKRTYRDHLENFHRFMDLLR